MVREHIVLVLTVHICAEGEKKIFLNSWDIFPVGRLVVNRIVSLTQYQNGQDGHQSSSTALCLMWFYSYSASIPLTDPPISLEAP